MEGGGKNMTPIAITTIICITIVTLVLIDKKL